MRRRRPDIFDEYTRRQYVAKAPSRNPYGTDETPNKFAEFDVFTKLRVLFQLSQWTLLHPDRMRERMPEAKDAEQTQWVRDVVYPHGWKSTNLTCDSESKRLDTTSKNASTLSSMTTVSIEEPIPHYPHHPRLSRNQRPSPRPSRRLARQLRELARGERLQSRK